MQREYGPSVLHQDGCEKPLLYLPHWLFVHIRNRGNTHYCAKCLGYAGFRPGRKNRVLNSLETRCKLTLPDGVFMRMRDAVINEELAPHIYDLPDHPRHYLGEGRPYDRWLTNCAFFSYSQRLRTIAKKRGWTVFQCDPMHYHNDIPGSHTPAVVGRIHEFNEVSAWLKAVQPDFAYRIIIQF